MKLSAEEKAARVEARKVARAEAKKVKDEEKKLARIESYKNQPRIGSLKISIEWAKSKTWGSNPQLTAQAYDRDGKYVGTTTATCSGCGYDKESTVIADAFNHFLRYKLYIVDMSRGKKPYGMTAWQSDPSECYYEGGVGTDCYYKIAEYIGGTFKHIASGKTYDAYEYVASGLIV